MSQKYLAIRELSAKLGGRSISSINRDELSGDLPKSVKLGTRRYWAEAEVDAHIEGLREQQQGQ